MSTSPVIPHGPFDAPESGRTWSSSFELRGLKATELFATAFAAAARPGLRIGMSGALGAGKTELTRQIALSLGASNEQVSSPTYVLESVYTFAPKITEAGTLDTVRHWDWYRLRGGELPPEIMDERLSARSVILVEWSDRCPDWDDIEDIHCELLHVGGHSDWRLANVAVRDSRAAQIIHGQIMSWQSVGA